MKEALTITGSAIHELQRERGCASVVLNSNGSLFLNRIEEQFKATDKVLKAFDEAGRRWIRKKTLKETQTKRLENILEKCLTLSSMRREIMSLEIQQYDAIDYYTHQLIGPMIQANVEVALYEDGVSPNKATAYSAFMQWKERVGLERALGTRGFVSYRFHDREFLERIMFLLSEQENYRSTFFLLAGEEFQKIVQGVTNSDVFKKINTLHDTLKSDLGLLSDMTPKDWFDLISRKIDLLHKCEKQLINAMTAKNGREQTGKTAPSDYHETDNHIDLIKSFRMFHGLSEKNLEQLLQKGQIRKFPKGKMLFLEGEQANRLYVVLNGWVKVYKGTASGEETILQMLSSGDSIMESAVFLNSPYPVSSQIVESATLLSLPAQMIREQLRKNNELALNLLASMSYRSQNLIRQIESARLKSADQRVGWFLLKLMLEQGRSSRNIALPYDKSMIASYLDMKRETFSRALKRLKSKNFSIENDTIVMPSLSSLCGYCDSDLASECKLHGTPECPNPQCIAPDESAA